MLGIMPRFSIKDLLVGMTLIALGLIILFISVPAQSGALAVWLVSAMYFGGFMLIVAGVFAPFRDSWLGVAVGLVAALAIGSLVAFISW